MKSLADLELGETATVKNNLISGELRQRFLNIGLIENTEVNCVAKSPAGNPKAFLIRGAVIAIRNEDSQNILIKEEL